MDANDNNRYDWVQLVDPKSQQLMYINLKSGECSRDPPENSKYKTVSPNQWWELFDIKAQRNYYYNSSTRETVWQKPIDGDIIPLTKIQFLQQNLQPSSLMFQKDDNGILRHSNNNNNHMNTEYQEERLSTSLNQRKYTGSLLTTEIPDYSYNNIVAQQNNNSNKFSHHPVPISTNTNHDRSILINESMNSIHSPLLLLSSSRTTAMTDIPNISNTNHVNIDNQRVRDWLRDAIVTTTNEMKSTIFHNNTVTATTTTTTNNNNNNNNNHTNELIIDNGNSNIKKPSCLSDRPIRRHNIQSSQLQGLIEFPASSGDQSSNLQFRSVPHSVNPNYNNSVNLISVCGNTCQTSSSCNTPNYPVQYDQHVPFKFLNNITNTVSSEPTTSIQNESGINNSDESISDMLQNTNLSNNRSFQHFNPSMCGVVKQSSMPPTMSCGITQPAPRQRAFPRTNPTVSRPSGNDNTCFKSDFYALQNNKLVQLTMLLHLLRTPVTRITRCFGSIPVVSKTIDRFNGIHLNIVSFKTNDTGYIIQHINDIINNPSGFKAIWVTLKVEHSELVPLLCKSPPIGPGMKFHHARNSEATLVRWLGEGASRLPDYASHQVGVAGVLINSDFSEILMVREKVGPSFRCWKFPTGLLNVGEDIAQAAVREMLEECGIHTKFCGVIAFRQQHNFPEAFGISDLLFTCRLKLSDDMPEPVIKICTQEIAECKWIPIAQLLSANIHTGVSTPVNHDQDQLNITTFTHKIVQLIMMNHSKSGDYLSSNEFIPHRLLSVRNDKVYDLFLPRNFNLD
ncbi:unnamed protein product [Schistosoma turkestanicum]|nr:unnamed protein product [Schistosoma turkestanicum]